jgi:hypothetical protein
VFKFIIGDAKLLFTSLPNQVRKLILFQSRATIHFPTLSCVLQSGFSGIVNQLLPIQLSLLFTLNANHLVSHTNQSTFHDAIISEFSAITIAHFISAT